jgi:uncharacterized membrane protein YqiK
MADANKRPNWGWWLGVSAAGVALFYLFWVWVVERVEVGPGEFLVRIHLWGKDLPEGEILAPDESYKGIMQDVLPEGRHFINPLFWTYERKKMITVEPGKCLVVTRKFGKVPPPGQILARDDERGIVPEVLRPGNHRINPYAYHVEETKAIEIKAEQVGVRTLLVGKNWREEQVKHLGKEWPSPYVVPVVPDATEGFRGVQAVPVPPGTYYINPYVEMIVPVDISIRHVEFKDIQFPSKDGFLIKPHVLVNYQVVADTAPELFVLISDEGRLCQEDQDQEQIAKNEVLQKIVLPLVRGYVRIEGSKYEARDFVTQSAKKARNPREELQDKLLAKVKEPCREVGVVIESIILSQSDDLKDNQKELTELANIIADRERARLKREQNKETIEQYTKDQETKAAEALSTQNSKKVAAQTKLVEEEKKAEQRLEVEEARLKQDLTNAKTRLEAARAQVKATIALGKAEADVINAQNEAEVSGLKKKVESFPSPDLFAQSQVLSKLAPALAEIFASDGSDFAKLFAAYMTPPANKAAPAPTGPPAPAPDK